MLASFFLDALTFSFAAPNLENTSINKVYAFFSFQFLSMTMMSSSTSMESSWRFLDTSSSARSNWDCSLVGSDAIKSLSASSSSSGLASASNL